MTIKTKMRLVYAPLLILSAALHAQSIPRMGNNLRLFTGAQYIPNGQHAQGYPFFQSNTLLDGTVFYDGAIYEHIPIRYDLITGEVVIHDSINDANISLVREHLPRFIISGHVFLWLPDTGDSSASLEPGYYEILVDGPCTLIAKHSKKLVYPTNNEDILKYTGSTTYFLQVHNQYVRVDGQRSLLKALSDKKDPLKKYIRQNNLDFTKDPGHALTETIHYYTQLKN